MIFSHLLRRGIPPRIRVIFDISSGSIGATIVSSNSVGAPYIHYWVRQPIPFQKHFNAERLLNLMQKTLSSVAEDIIHKGFPAVRGKKAFMHSRLEEIVCVLSSPWSSSRVKVLRYQKEKPFPVTNQLLRDLIDQTQKHALREMATDEGPSVNDAHEVIEQSIIHIALNGYPTSSPHGKSARRIELSLLVSLVDEQIQAMIRTTLSECFHIGTVSLRSSTLVTFSAVRNLYPDANDFLLVDVGGELTDVAVIREDVLVDLVSFPVGKNTLIRSIATKLGTHPEEAYSLLRMAETNGTSPQVRIDTIRAAEKRWEDAFEHALADLSANILLPGSLFLTAEEDTLAWFSKLVGKTRFGNATVTNEAFLINPLTQKELCTSYQSDKNLIPDPTLTLEALFEQQRTEV
jgi:hypothetical protein